MSDNTGSAEKPVAPIDEAITDLSHNLGRLEEVLTMLYDKIKPVMGADLRSESPIEQGLEVKVSDGNSRLFLILDELNTKAISLRHEANAMIGRIQL